MPRSFIHLGLIALIVLVSTAGWARSDPMPVTEAQQIAQIEATFANRYGALGAAHESLNTLRETAAMAQHYQALGLAAGYQAHIGLLLALFTETEAMLDEVLLRHRHRLSPVARGDLELLQANAWRRLEQLDRASARLAALESEFEGQDSGLLARILLAQNDIAHLQGNFDQAVAKGLSALRLMEAQDDVDGLIRAHKSLGVDFLRLDDLESSLFHFEQGQALLERSSDPDVAMDLYANMGITLQAMGQLDRAREAYQSTYDSAVAAGRVLTQAQSLLNIATMYSRAGLSTDYESAIDYYQRSLDISLAHGLDYGVMLNHLNIGVALSGLGRVDEALMSFEQARVLAETLGRPNEMRHILGQISEVLAKADRYQEAYERKLEEIELSVQLFNERRDRAVADLRVEYEVERKDQALALAEARNLQQTQRIQALVVLSLMLALLLLVGGGFLFYRNRSLEQLYQRNVELLEAFQARKADRSSRAGSADHADPLQVLYERLQHLIETEALYKNEGLTLAGLAKEAHSNEKYVSNAISRFAQTNFSNFINYYRIQEAKRLLRSPQLQSSITDAMLECGFGHKSTFYAAFKKFTGMTPTQFRAVAVKEAAELRHNPSTPEVSSPPAA